MGGWPGERGMAAVQGPTWIARVRGAGEVPDTLTLRGLGGARQQSAKGGALL